MTIFFFFNDTATTEIYTLSLHDALPISQLLHERADLVPRGVQVARSRIHVLVMHVLVKLEDRSSKDVALAVRDPVDRTRSEEHTSELQSRQYLVCRLLLEKKKSSPPLYS